MLFPDKNQLITYGGQVLRDHSQADKVATRNARFTIKTLTADQMQITGISTTIFLRIIMILINNWK